MTLREIFLSSFQRFKAGYSARFPIHLNLVDHFGQRSPAEALIRHCEQIGFASANGLIGAWRAGFCDLLLDGFDELYTTKFVLSVKNMRKAKSDSLELVRRFVKDTPVGSRVFMAGRSSYFGASTSDLRNALALSEDFTISDISNFSPEQVERYLANHNLHQSLPDWLPRRPLLLGYLISRHVFDKLALNNFQDAANGWDYLLDQVAAREADQSPAGLRDPVAVRRFLERLAWEARGSQSGRGPLSIEILRRTFSDVFGFEMNAESELFVYRLCGLASSSSDPEAREFFDLDFCDACASANVARYATSPFENSNLIKLRGRHQLGELGVRMCCRDIQRAVVGERLFRASFEHCINNSGDSLLLFDLIQVFSMVFGGKVPPVTIRECDIDALVVTAQSDLSQVFFDECVIDQLYVEEEEVGQKAPRLRSCLVTSLIGRANRDALPPGMIDAATEVISFADTYDTNAQILRSGLPVEMALLITVLRKLFVQRGRGRRENAFYRGIEPQHRSTVKSILEIIVSSGLASPAPGASGVVYLPNYSRSHEVFSLLASPLEARSDLTRAVKDL